MIVLRPAPCDQGPIKSCCLPRESARPCSAADITLDRADAHEVEPASQREAGHVHLVEVEGAVLLLPVVVVRGMATTLPAVGGCPLDDGKRRPSA